MESRDQLVTAIHKHFVNTTEGGSACVVSGGPGVGKTYLVERFMRELPSKTPRLRGRGLRTGTAPLLPICEAIRSCEAGANLDRLKATAEEYVGAVPFVKEALAPLVRARTKTQYARSELKGVIPSETYTFVVLAKLLESLGGTDPPVLFLDDLQWMDAASVGFLGYLASQMNSKRVFLLLTRRLNGKENERITALLETLRREAPGKSVELSVSGLSRSEQVAALASLLGNRIDFDDADLDWIQRATHGNPYYLRELLDLLRERGHLAQTAGVWRLAEKPLASLVAPSLTDHFRQRFQRACDTTASATETLQFAACVGTVFDARIVADSMSVSARSVAATLGAVAATTGLVSRVGSTTSYCFDHDLARDGILADLGEFALELHQKVGVTLSNRRDVDPAVVAYQFAAARAYEGASSWFLRAADAANEKYLFDAASQYAMEAEAALAKLEVGARDPLRLHSTTTLGTALVGAERYQAAAEMLGARTNGLTDEQAAPIKRLLGRASARLPDDASHHAAVTLLREALRGFHEGTHDAERAATWSDLIYAYDAVGDYAASQAAFRAAARSAKLARDNTATVRLMRLTCVFWQPEKVAEALEKSIALARRQGLHYEEALCHNNLGSAWFAMHDLDRAQHHYQRSYDGLSALGGFRCDTPLNNLGLVALVASRPDEADRLLQTAAARCLDEHSALFIRSNQAVLKAKQGKMSTAIEELRKAVSVADLSGDLFYQDCLRHNLARALHIDGNSEEAYQIATGCSVHHSTGDELLVLGKRARLLLELLTPEQGSHRARLLDDAAVLDRTTKPQAWLYREPWYYCDIEFWED